MTLSENIRDKAMKVVFCAYDGKNIINGINAWLIRLLPQLAAHNVKVSVIFITWAPEAECTTIPQLREQGIECMSIPLANYTEKQVKWILEYLNLKNPDVFVPGNMVPALYASKMIKDAGVSTIGILHNDDEEYAAILSHFTDSFNIVVPVSNALFKKIKEHNINIVTRQIPYGAKVPDDKASFNYGNTFNVVYIGRIVKKQKRIDEVTTAFCQGALQLPDCRFTIYGSGTDEYLVTDILARYGNPKNLIFAGSLPNSAVQKVLLQSHMVVLMSDYEGIPVAMMEAMACGVVPVCKMIESGIPELIKNGETGIFINEPDELSAVIKQLKQQPEEWQRLSANCRQLIIKEFSAAKNVRDWLALLDGVRPDNKTKIQIPRKIQLPTVNNALTGGDNRDPGLVIKGVRKIRRTLKSIGKPNAN